MKFFFDSRNKKYKQPFGALKSGSKVAFCVISDADSIFIHGFGEPVEMEKKDNIFSAVITPNIAFGVVFYHFEVIKNGIVFLFGRGDKTGIAVKDGKPYQLTVHKNNANPDWFCGSTIYQIYVDRFFKGKLDEVRERDHALIHTTWNDKPLYIKNNNGEVVAWDFYGGNLSGVIQKLDYLNSLGVDIIYLNPVFESISNHKYDTANYNEIDRMYGTTKTLKRLIDDAANYGIKIMLDGVFSHTGDNSIYFNKYKHYGDGGAYNDPNSVFCDWYTFEKYPDKYDCWWGVTSLPCVKKLTPSYLDYLLNENYGAVIKWMKLGIAGWRLDVADELPDEFIKKLKDKILKVNPQAVLLGEIWEDASNKVSYDMPRNYILENSLDSVSNYPLRDSLILLLTDRCLPSDFAETVMMLQENYPKNVFLSLMNMTGTHDTIRLMTVLGDAPDPKTLTTWQQREYMLPDAQKKLALQRLCLYYIILYTLPGNPSIYYGDEICLEGYKDPYNRSTFDWNSKHTIITGLIQKLSKLRKNLNTKSGFVQFNDNSSMLSYDVCSSRTRYTVYVNVSSQPIKKECTVSTIPFLHNATVKDSTVTIELFGAVVLLI